MRFAFLAMGDYNTAADRAAIGDGSACIIGVKNVEQACRVAQELQADGIDCIELCGAFGQKGARAVIEATGNAMPIGYITHLPEQDEVYVKTFYH